MTRGTLECVKWMMRWFLCIAIILALGASLLAADNPPPSVYLQIVRGAKNDKAKAAGWKAIGPKLAKRLKRVDPWDYYWETSRHEIAPSAGKPRRIQISSGRELEIIWLGSQQVELRMYRNGMLRRKCKVAMDTAMSIMGGDATSEEGWFVVVRNDKPTVQ